jgi:hypothetical protein
MKLMSRAQPSLTIYEIKGAEEMDVESAMVLMARVIVDYFGH